jgi:hypothetical protein
MTHSAGSATTKIIFCSNSFQSQCMNFRHAVSGRTEARSTEYNLSSAGR